ncbi:cation diffusion facilitator family transporter [Formivibrio citricus]|uniref:Cation diffusion facilitator family transporter n=1 Tax=Formivibrio citricus TaxID=83765 RepID=A0A1I4WU11_9NEIS|nr:cation diffusion facilitator family transporter [Formivibrio citricus]SFN17291.1 cation diffusion facilitator family transporter [Formivibrio citricus]
MSASHADPSLTPDERHAAAVKSTWVSVFINIVLTFGQIFAGVITGSFGLIADGIHSLSDLVADFVVLLAARHSREDADEHHHYGHARFENAASLLLGVLLLVVGVYMGWAAIQKFMTPGSMGKVGSLALWVALISLAAKECLFRYMLAVAERIGSSMLVANAWHARSDALSSLVVAAGIGGNMLGYPVLDPLAGLVVGVMVGKMGWEFTRAAFDDLTDHALPEDEVAAIQTTAQGTSGVLGVHDIRTRKMGDFAMVDLHIEVDPEVNVAVGHDIGVEVRRRVMEEHKVLNVLVHVDPAGEDPDRDHEPVMRRSFEV